MADATTVFVFQQYDPVPVYHLPAWLVEGREQYRDAEDGSGSGLAACGLKHATWDAEGNATYHAIRLRWDHARLIGRMCKRCETLYYGSPE